MKIYKYDLEIKIGAIDTAEIEMPVNSVPLHVGYQRGQLMLWVRVNTNPDAAVLKHKFKIYGTGRTISNDRELFIGTVLEGPFVWHVFSAGYEQV